MWLYAAIPSEYGDEIASWGSQGQIALNMVHSL